MCSIPFEGFAKLGATQKSNSGRQDIEPLSSCSHLADTKGLATIAIGCRSVRIGESGHRRESTLSD